MGIVILSFAIALSIAFALILRGWHGKRVGDHAVCRQCGFNLTGQPLDSHRCSECGADTAKPGAILIGDHRRRLVPLSLGTGLLFLCVWLLATQAPSRFAAIRQFELIHYQPVWWLIRHYGTHPTGEAATKELQRRVAAGDFTDADFESFAEKAMKSPQGSQTSELYGYLELACRGWARGQLRVETMQRLVHHQNQFGFWVPEFVSAEEVPTLLSSYLSNATSFAKLHLDVAYDPGTMVVGDTSRVWNYRRPKGTISTGKYLPAWAIPPGVETSIRVRTRATVTITGGPSTIVDTVEIDRSATTLVVAPEYFKRPIAQEQEVTPTKSTVTLSKDRDGKFEVLVEVRVHPETPFIGDIYVATSDEEAKLGEFDIEYGGGYKRFGPFDAFPEPPFKLILRPVPDRYMDSFNRTPTFQKEIVIDDPILVRERKGS